MLETVKQITYNSTIKSYNPEKRTLLSYISTSDPDWVGDIIVPSGLTHIRLEDGSPKKPKVLKNHDPNQVIAQCNYVKAFEKGLLAETKFIDTPESRAEEYLYSIGAKTDFSVGIKFSEKDMELNEFGGITIKKFYLDEYSLVTFGMNPYAVSKSEDVISKHINVIEQIPEEKYDELLLSVCKSDKDFLETIKSKRIMDNKFETIEKEISEYKKQLDEMNEKINSLFKVRIEEQQISEDDLVALYNKIFKE